MPRDEGLEELLKEQLEKEPGITEQAMFGGRAWLLNGNLLCGARDDGMLVHQVCARYSSGPSRTGTNAKFGWLSEAKRENTRSGL